METNRKALIRRSTSAAPDVVRTIRSPARSRGTATDGCRTTPAGDDGAELTAALHTIGEFGEWIRSADSKAALLAAVQGVLITGPIGRLSALRSSSGITIGWLECVTVATFLTALAISATALFVSHLPRLPVSHRTRFAFPVVARLPAEALHGHWSSDELLEQAWLQAAALARIAVTKYRWLRAAGALTSVTVALLLLCCGLSLALPLS